MQPNELSLKTAITPAGIIVLGLSFSTIIYGTIASPQPIEYIGFLGLIWIMLTRIFCRQQLKSVQLKRALPKRAFPTQSFNIAIEIINLHGKQTIRDIRLYDLLASAREPISITAIAAQSVTKVNYPNRLGKRGRTKNNHYQLQSTWPFGLFETNVIGEFQPARPGDESMLIVPKPFIPTFLEEILKNIEQQETLFSLLRADHLNEFRSMRDYQSGDTVRSIHWPSSSKSQSLVVREYDPPEPRPQLYGIYLHQYISKGELNTPDRLERMLRVATGLLVRFSRAEIPILVRIDFPETRWFEIPTQHSFEQLLDLLAEATATHTSLNQLSENWQPFSNCERVFVLSTSHSQNWRSSVETNHTAIIFVDSTKASSAKSNLRIAKK